MPRAVDIFVECERAVTSGNHIRRQNRRDKEFHFQDWFGARLRAVGIPFDDPGRNSYPDFRLVRETEGYEIKGLAYPGREANYDCNSQVPVGRHNERTIYYVFGRYPAEPENDEYPVLDLVICHGDFLNANHDYVHKNRNVKGFGSYGDIMIRDRKMYVAPTPFALTSGTARDITLIVPSTERTDASVVAVGDLVRRETDEIVVGYQFNLRTNEITTEKIRNPHAGMEHRFTAYRVRGKLGAQVAMRAIAVPPSGDDLEDDDA